LFLLLSSSAVSESKISKHLYPLSTILTSDIDKSYHFVKRE